MDIIPLRIMTGVGTVKLRPWLDHMTLLGIPETIVRTHILVESALITIRPYDYAGMIDITDNHLMDKTMSSQCVIWVLPSGQFVDHIEAKRIARIQEEDIRRIVRHTHGIHVHVLDKVYVLYGESLAARTPVIRTESVAAHALETHLGAIHIKTITITKLYGPETEFLLHAMDQPVPLHEAHHGLVQDRCLTGP